MKNGDKKNGAFNYMQYLTKMFKMEFKKDQTFILQDLLISS